jgi:hypothetical protein
VGISVDSKLVGVAPATLKLEGQTVISSRAKAAILANAGALR